MVARRIDIHQAPAWVAALGKSAREAAKRGLLAAAVRTVGHIQNVVIPGEPLPPVSRGAYKAAWRARATGEGAEVLNTIPYAAVIEYGARAGNIRIGRKMIDALADWARLKGLRFTRPSGEAMTPREMAWAIAMGMKRRGIFAGGKGLRILEKASAEIPRFIREEVRREFRRM